MSVPTPIPPLELAAQIGNQKEIERLLNNKEIRSDVKQTISALFIAIRAGHLEVIDCFLNMPELSLCLKCEDMQFELLVVAAMGDLKTLKFFFGKPEFSTFFKMRTLYPGMIETLYDSCKKDLETFKYLLGRPGLSLLQTQSTKVKDAIFITACKIGLVAVKYLESLPECRWAEFLDALKKDPNRHPAVFEAVAGADDLEVLKYFSGTFKTWECHTTIAFMSWVHYVWKAAARMKDTGRLEYFLKIPSFSKDLKDNADRRQDVLMAAANNENPEILKYVLNIPEISTALKSVDRGWEIDILQAAASATGPTNLAYLLVKKPEFKLSVFLQENGIAQVKVLIAAAGKGNLETLKYLLERSELVKCLNEYKQMKIGIVRAAAVSGKIEALKYLLNDRPEFKLSVFFKGDKEAREDLLVHNFWLPHHDINIPHLLNYSSETLNLNLNLPTLEYLLLTFGFSEDHDLQIAMLNKLSISGHSCKLHYVLKNTKIGKNKEAIKQAVRNVSMKLTPAIFSILMDYLKKLEDWANPNLHLVPAITSRNLLIINYLVGIEEIRKKAAFYGVGLLMEALKHSSFFSLKIIKPLLAIRGIEKQLKRDKTHKVLRAAAAKQDNHELVFRLIESYRNLGLALPKDILIEVERDGKKVNIGLRKFLDDSLLTFVVLRRERKEKNLGKKTFHDVPVEGLEIIQDFLGVVPTERAKPKPKPAGKVTVSTVSSSSLTLESELRDRDFPTQPGSLLIGFENHKNKDEVASQPAPQPSPEPSVGPPNKKAKCVENAGTTENKQKDKGGSKKKGKKK